MTKDWFDPSVLDHSSARVRRIYGYWASIRGNRPMPRRADFDPMAIPQHLPGILLIDVEGLREGGGGRYRYRVVGGWEVASRGHNPTGCLVEDGFFGASLETVLADYDFVVSHRAPLYAPLDFLDDRGRKIEEYSIVLPFSENGRNVSQLLVYSERRTLEEEEERFST